MKTQLLISAALASTAVFAQAPDVKGNVAYQQIGVMGAAGAGPIMFKVLGPDGSNGPTVTGRPFSATEQHHSLEVLADGTRIENTESNAFYRDDQGRTRTEHGPAGSTRVMIHDPVTGYSVMLDPANKIAHKLPGLPPGPPLPASISAVHTAGVGGVAFGSGTTAFATEGRRVMIKHTEVNMPEPAKEELGTEVLNGVPAQGTRTTLTIPVGQIGNDRAIQVANERWYSSDLQVLVKTVNKDPRFGETTYELTNIDRTPPSAALFQIPSDYTVEEGNGKVFGETRSLDIGK